MTRYRYSGDPATGPLFWLCLPIVLACLVGKVAWAWLKTKMPHAPAPIRRCQECGWVLRPEETVLMCHRCLAAAWIAEESVASRLFCCDVDLTPLGILHTSARPAVDGSTSTTRHYRCQACGRIWLYIEDRHPGGGSDADWYPQQTEADGGKLPELYDERTRTKVYQ